MFSKLTFAQELAIWVGGALIVEAAINAAIFVVEKLPEREASGQARTALLAFASMLETASI